MISSLIFSMYCTLINLIFYSRNFIRQSEALTNAPNQSRLKKSKSMVKKSKSVIMTSKDIPMNAFMAIKNTADSEDSKWLQSFLSESVMEDIPWECSKALIIMKNGFQVHNDSQRSMAMNLTQRSNFRPSFLARLREVFCSARRATL